MRKDAVKKYLCNFSESFRINAPINRKWRHTLIIPVYREFEPLLNNLKSLPTPSGDLLVVLVINKPLWEQKNDSNQEIRNFVNNLNESFKKNNEAKIKRLKDGIDILVIDLEKLFGSKAACGVGLARKIGCDLALAWHSAGAIESDWLSSTDADAILPPDYFDRIESIDSINKIICWPFAHMPSKNNSLNVACKMYVLQLHHYTLGLTYAKSPYNYHSLGSCISVKARPYAEVRGFPKRDAGEDFYMLNKLRKVGNIKCLTGQCISIVTRESDRVPFGTGPATSKIIKSQVTPKEYKLYNPQSFVVLKKVINSIPYLSNRTKEPLRDVLQKQDLSKDLAVAAEESLSKLGINKAVIHCRKHTSSETAFLNQFLTWFDAFRTLKFIHYLENSHLPKISIKNYHNYVPSNWPVNIEEMSSLDDLLSAHRKYLDWRTMDPSHW